MILWKKKQNFNNLLESRLFDETSFYKQFIKDLSNAKDEVIIESPYLTSTRVELLLQSFQFLLDNGKKIHILTRDPSEHEDEYIRHQSTNEILKCIELGVNIVLLKGNHHRKLAIIDRQILWEGSLNILSNSNSLEIMRRIEGEDSAIEMFRFLQLNKVIKS